MLKVLLIGNLPEDKQPSMLAFQRVLARELRERGCDVRLVTPRPLLLRLRTPHATRKWVGYVDKFVVFPFWLRREIEWADVVHVTDHSNAMYVPWSSSRPTVVTCHDVIAIQAALGLVEGWQVRWTGRLFQRLISRGLQRADLIACVSDLTCRDLQRLDLRREPHVTTVHNGLNATFEAVDDSTADDHLSSIGLPKRARFLLHIGSDLPRKNRATVLDTFISLRRSGDADWLVFIGPELDAKMAATASTNGVSDRILTIGEVSHARLCALYTRAIALVFPSLQEGFGWPIIEAQACRCPVFTSNLPPMNEIGGDAAIYIDPCNATEIADAIRRHDSQMDEIRDRGERNAALYSTQRMISGYLDAYARAIDMRRSR